MFQQHQKTQKDVGFYARKSVLLNIFCCEMQKTLIQNQEGRILMPREKVLKNNRFFHFSSTVHSSSSLQLMVCKFFTCSFYFCFRTIQGNHFFRQLLFATCQLQMCLINNFKQMTTLLRARPLIKLRNIEKNFSQKKILEYRESNPVQQ